jgi:glyoxylase-like metal-dependent hydrolase (beta-lactamase superfamily II)
MLTMNKKMLIEHLSVGPLQVNCYLVACPETLDAVVIDPGDEAERILQTVKDAGFNVRTIINTHGHFDHVGANRAMVAATGAELLIHEDDIPLLSNAQQHAEAFGLSAVLSPEPTRSLSEGSHITVGSLDFVAYHVPGHSPGSVCLHCGDHLFVGDVLFAGSVGRTDLPGGDHDALIEGIREKLMTLPDETIVHPGHGPETTIGREKKHNPFVGLNAWT